MLVPSYSEISVKSLFKEAIEDPVVSQYLPSPEDNTNKLPERDFFFGVLATLKGDYLKSIISEAHLSRMKGEEDKEASQSIMIKSEWLEELNKYPYVSSKDFSTNFTLGKPGKRIYLIMERAKLLKARKRPVQH